MVARAEGIDNPKLDEAQRQVVEAGTKLVEARDQADLTPTQLRQVNDVISLSEQMRNGMAYVSLASSVSQVRQLERGVTQIISTIIDEQTRPEPGLLVLAQALDGRLSVSLQEIQVSNSKTIPANPVELYTEFGVELASIDRLAISLGQTDPRVLEIRQGNAQRVVNARGGNTKMVGASYEAYDVLIDDVLTEVEDNLATSARNAKVLTWVDSIIIGGALLAAIILALLVSRLLLGPIRRVRTGALLVAHERLPEAVARIRAGEDPGEIEPIGVTTHEETGQLARAVDDLHRQAVKLASGEANLRAQVGDMFVTLSRRNTSLINQQLGLIETLESDEEDPQRLESLFRLDHLASRMRRNAESLVILSGAPTRATEQDDLSLTDVLQAAIAGVQDYRRVQLDAAPAQRVSGEAAADVVHLLSELVDNALSYSPPSSQVMVTSSFTRGGVIVQVTDGGLGIADDIARRAQREAAGRWRGHARHRPPHGSLRGQPARPAPRPDGPARPERPDGHHRHRVPADQRAVRHRPAGGRFGWWRPGHRARRDPGRGDRGPRRVRRARRRRRGGRLPSARRRSPSPSRRTTPSPRRSTPTACRSAVPVRPVPDSGNLVESMGGGFFDRVEPDDDAAPEQAVEHAIEASADDVVDAVVVETDDDDTVDAHAEEERAPIALGPVTATHETDEVTAEAEVDEVEARGRRGRRAVEVEATESDDTESEDAEEHLEQVAEADDQDDERPTSLPRSRRRRRGGRPPRPGAGHPAAEPVGAVRHPGGRGRALPRQRQRQPTDTPRATGREGWRPGCTAWPRPPGASASNGPPTTCPSRLPPWSPPSSSPVSRLPSRTHVLGATAAATLNGAARTPASMDEDETPIFRSLRSNWLSSDSGERPWANSEVDAGWDAADRVEATPPTRQTETGLPVRRPGNRLIPGGLSTPAPVQTVRDPEAIRARLAAHAAGVSRGRNAAGVTDTTTQEADPA